MRAPCARRAVLVQTSEFRQSQSDFRFRFQNPNFRFQNFSWFSTTLFSVALLWSIMFWAPSKQFLRLTPSRLPWNAIECAPFSRCCPLYGNEQHRGRGRGARGQPASVTAAVESRDTFGSLSSSLASRNLQRRLADDDDDDDGGGKFREKIEDTLRPRCTWTNDVNEWQPILDALYLDRPTTSVR